MAGPLRVLWTSVLVLAATARTVSGNAALLADIEYGIAGGERLLLDVRRPAGQGPFPVVILIHGGGWTSGDKSGAEKPGSGADITPWFAPLEQSGFLAFSINYRLAPANRWPACLEDVQTAIRWVKAHAAEYGGDPARIALFGHSAGGHLACFAGVQIPEHEDTRVQAIVGFAPVTDHEQDLPVRGGLSASLQALLDRPKELTDDSRAVLRSISPINHVRAGLPPFLLVHGDADKTVPLVQSLNFQAKLRSAGVPCELITLPGAPHRLTLWDEHDPMWSQRVVAWLRRTLDSSPPQAP